MAANAGLGMGGSSPLPSSDPNGDDLSAILAPIFSCFSFPQLESVLYAYLPSRLEQHIHKTGIYAVDTFVVTATVTLLLVAAKLLLRFGTIFLNQWVRKSAAQHRSEIAVVIEPTQGQDEFSTSKRTHTHETMHHGPLNAYTLGMVRAHRLALAPLAPNVFHQALLYLVSNRVQNQSQGSYVLKPNNEVDRDALEPPDFHMVPQPNEGNSTL